LKAFLAALTATSTSAASASAILAITFPFAGFNVSNVLPLLASTNSLFINSLVNSIFGLRTVCAAAAAKCLTFDYLTLINLLAS